jgi:hypothetical protein
MDEKKHCRSPVVAEALFALAAVPVAPEEAAGRFCSCGGFYPIIRKGEVEKATAGSAARPGDCGAMVFPGGAADAPGMLGRRAVPAGASITADFRSPWTE